MSDVQRVWKPEGRKRERLAANMRRLTLRFSPYAWAKLLFLRDESPTEVGGFGISRGEDLLLVEDVQLVLQRSGAFSVCFDDGAVADYFDRQVDEGRRPEQFGRIWLHTHPGSSPEPSATDEATFARCFRRADWAVMFILAEDQRGYARLRFGVGPGAELKIPVAVDYGQPFPAADRAAWQREYEQSVVAERSVAEQLLPAEAAFQAWPDAWELEPPDTPDMPDTPPEADEAERRYRLWEKWR